MVLQFRYPLQESIGYMALNIFVSIVVELSIIMGVVYLLWRTWAFSLLPLLRPHEPRELPYCVPGKSSCNLSTRR